MDNSKKRAGLIVTIEWVLLAVAIIAGIIIINRSSNQDNYRGKSTIYNYSHYKPNPSLISQEKIIMIAIAVGVSIYLVSNIILTFAVYKEHITCCQIWYLLGVVGIGIQVLCFGDAIYTRNAVAIVGHCIYLSYKCYAVQTIVNYANGLHMRMRNSPPEVIYNYEGCQYP